MCFVMRIHGVYVKPVKFPVFFNFAYDTRMAIFDYLQKYVFRQLFGQKNTCEKVVLNFPT